mmetsp:Transcript_48097/g.79988  ORF Transcript_48097/g.79988 Transcript_48097/m.79988 type:complete len:104 (+) Transcript_48097:112-423(+)
MTTPRAVKSLYRELLREARNWPKASRSGPLLVSAIEARTKTLFREHVNVVDEAKALEMFSEGRKELAALKTIRENVFKKMHWDLSKSALLCALLLFNSILGPF